MPDGRSNNRAGLVAAPLHPGHYSGLKAPCIRALPCPRDLRKITLIGMGSETRRTCPGVASV